MPISLHDLLNNKHFPRHGLVKFLKNLMFGLNVPTFQACKKMHNVHNEYILLLCEAAEFERDMRTILLPGLLEHQQAIHEDSTDRWKMILQDIYR